MTAEILRGISARLVHLMQTGISLVKENAVTALASVTE
jgi:hypothetical protein